MCIIRIRGVPLKDTGVLRRRSVYMRPDASRAMLLNVFFCSVDPSGRTWELSSSTTAENGTFGTGVTKNPAMRTFTPRYGGGVVAVVGCPNASGAERIATPNR